MRRTESYLGWKKRKSNSPYWLRKRFCGVFRHKHMAGKSLVCWVLRNKTKIPAGNRQGKQIRHSEKGGQHCYHLLLNMWSSHCLTLVLNISSRPPHFSSISWHVQIHSDLPHTTPTSPHHTHIFSTIKTDFCVCVWSLGCYKPESCNKYLVISVIY